MGRVEETVINCSRCRLGTPAGTSSLRRMVAGVPSSRFVSCSGFLSCSVSKLYMH